MTSTRSVHLDPEVRKTESDRCIHCFGGIVYEPTEDTLVDEAHECHMCFGTARKMDRVERKSMKAARA